MGGAGGRGGGRARRGRKPAKDKTGGKGIPRRPQFPGPSSSSSSTCSSNKSSNNTVNLNNGGPPASPGGSDFYLHKKFKKVISTVTVEREDPVPTASASASSSSSNGMVYKPKFRIKSNLEMVEGEEEKKVEDQFPVESPTTSALDLSVKPVVNGDLTLPPGSNVRNISEAQFITFYPVNSSTEPTIVPSKRRRLDPDLIPSHFFGDNGEVSELPVNLSGKHDRWEKVDQFQNIDMTIKASDYAPPSGAKVRISPNNGPISGGPVLNFPKIMETSSSPAMQTIISTSPENSKRPTFLALKPINVNSNKLESGILPSPETPRRVPKPSKQMTINGQAYTYLDFKVSTRSSYTCLFKTQPMFIPQESDAKLSMYTNWQPRPRDPNQPEISTSINDSSLNGRKSPHKIVYTSAICRGLQTMTVSSPGNQSPISSPVCEQKTFLSGLQQRGPQVSASVMPSSLSLADQVSISRPLIVEVPSNPEGCSSEIFQVSPSPPSSLSLSSSSPSHSLSVSSSLISSQSTRKFGALLSVASSLYPEHIMATSTKQARGDSRIFPEFPRSLDVEAPGSDSSTKDDNQSDDDMEVDVGVKLHQPWRSPNERKEKKLERRIEVLPVRVSTVSTELSEAPKPPAIEIRPLNVSPIPAVAVKNEPSTFIKSPERNDNVNGMEISPPPRLGPPPGSHAESPISKLLSGLGLPALKPEAEFRQPSGAQALVKDKEKSECNVCGKTFTRASQLTLHMNVHYIERPFRCDPCGISFKTKGLLVKHRRSSSHNCKVNLTEAWGVVANEENPRPFKCPDCNIAFRIHGHLAKHLRSKLHIMRMECLGKLPLGIFFEMETSGINLTDIDTTDCDMCLVSLQTVARKIYGEQWMDRLIVPTEEPKPSP